LDAMRAALLDGTGIAGIAHLLLVLLLFAVLLLPASIAFFSWSLRRTKMTGTLTHR
jgi:hypothetical protein